MTEKTAEAGKGAPAPIVEEKAFMDVLKGFLGKVFTVANPESYEASVVGHQLTESFYKAKLIGLGTDYLIVATEYKHAGRDAVKEPCKQYIPLARIKRVTLMKSERVMHL